MRVLFFCIYFFVANSISAQVNINKLKNAASKAEGVINRGDLSADEVVHGLKETLKIGVKNSIKNTAKKGGFYNNPLIRIGFPKDVKKVKVALVQFGMKSQVNKFEQILNNVAEDASYFAKDIFINAVKSITFKDAISILNGGDNSATMYLQNKTSNALYLKFRPIVSQSIAKVHLTKYWEGLVENYNSIPFTKDVNTDLDDYVTNQTIDGLFILISQEEENIRNNSNARVSDILQKVFK